MSIEHDKEYLELLKMNYQNLHTAVWDAHKVSWTLTGILVPIISGGFGFFLKEYGDKPLCPQKFLIAVLLTAVTWFWYLMIKNFDAYNRVRFSQLRDIEDALETYRPDSVTYKAQFKQYQLRYSGLFNKLCLALSLLLTGLLACVLLRDLEYVLTHYCPK